MKVTNVIDAGSGTNNGDRRGGWWKILSIALVGAAFGPLGGALAGGAIAYGESRGWWKGGPSNQDIVFEFRFWEERYLAPYYRKLAGALDKTPHQAIIYLQTLNNYLSEMASWKAYYEQVAIRSTDDYEVELAELKVEELGALIDIVKEKWYEIVAPTNPGISFYPELYDPTSYVNISGDILNWQGSKVVAERYYAAFEPHGGLPDGGGNTGGGNTGGGNTGGGGTTPTNPPATHPPRVNPNINPWSQAQTAAPKKDNTLMIVGLAVGASLLLRRRRK